MVTASGATRPVALEAGGSARNMEQRVNNDIAEYRPAATAKAYDAKLDEYFGYCEEFYLGSPHFGESTYQVTEEKVFKFMWYQCYREQKPRGGRRRRIGEEVPPVFNREEYRRVQLEYAADLNKVPVKPIGSSAMTQYMAAITELLSKQRAQHTNDLTDAAIRSRRVAALCAHVKNRKTAVSRANYDERIDADILPYMNAQSYPIIEGELWRVSRMAQGRHNILAALRNRSMLIDSKSGILRGESLLDNDLSDNLSIFHDNGRDPTPYLIGIQQMVKGKTHRFTKGHVRARVLLSTISSSLTLSPSFLENVWKMDSASRPEALRYWRQSLLPSLPL
jgi:hypothetical protein